MKPSLVYLGLAAALALTVAGGALQGHMRYRWGPSQAMQEAARKLQNVPSSFGGPQKDRWKLKSSDPLSDDTIEMLECTGYVARTYENRYTGEAVSLFVVIGPAGPIAVHTPEICYSAQDFTIRDARKRVAIAGDDQFWTVTFRKKDFREDLLRVYWAWTTSGRWSVPDGGRYAWVGSPYLYKIQLSSEMPAASNLAETDTCREFLKDFLPELRPYLRPVSDR